MNNKAFFSALLALSLAAKLFSAPFVVNPKDSVYRWIDIWSLRGYIEDEVFLLRPYGPEVLLDLLYQVEARGGDDDKALARRFSESIVVPKIALGTRVNGRLALSTSSKGLGLVGGLELNLSAEVYKNIWAAGLMTVEANYVSSSLTAPRGEIISGDGVYAGGNLSSSVNVLLSIESAVFAGNSNLWLSVGMGHSSYGPFFENGIVIGPQAPQTPVFDLNLRYGRWRYTMALLELQKGGTSNGVIIPSDTGKHAFFHSFSFSPSTGIDLGIYEAIVSANRFDPMYLIPLADYYLLQDRDGYSSDAALGDNALAGLYFSMRNLRGLAIKGIVFIDDFEFNEIFLNSQLDTKYICSGQLGLEWAPELGPMKRLRADYTAIFPYMYTHYYSIGSVTNGKAISNFQNDWTTGGENLGPALLPNSDRVEVAAYFSLKQGIELSPLLRLIRHGNASSGVTGLGTNHDGGLGDNGWGFDSTGRYGASYQQPYDTGTSPKYFRFLTQDILEYSWQAGLGFSWEASLGKTELSLSARYLYEYRVNDDLDEGVTTSRHYLSFGAKILF